MTDNKKKEIRKQIHDIIWGFDAPRNAELGYRANLKKIYDWEENKLLSLCESIRAEALKEVEGEIEKLYNEKYSHVTRDYRTEDQFRDDIIGQHGVLAKLSKGKNET